MVHPCAKFDETAPRGSWDGVSISYRLSVYRHIGHFFFTISVSADIVWEFVPIPIDTERMKEELEKYKKHENLIQE